MTDRPLLQQRHDTCACLVRTSFQQVVPAADLFADIFYDRLFLLDPSLRPMFRGDMKEQGRKLVGILQVAVAGLDHLDRIVEAVKALGRRHAGYGVREEHYGTVKAALLWALRCVLAHDCTKAVVAAWAEVYDLLAGVMRAAAAELDLPPAEEPPRVAAFRGVPQPSLS
jgi:hemoglobin-like flavoprotein